MRPPVARGRLASAIIPHRPPGRRETSRVGEGEGAGHDEVRPCLARLGAAEAGPARTGAGLEVKLESLGSDLHLQDVLC